MNSPRAVLSDLSMAAGIIALFYGQTSPSPTEGLVFVVLALLLVSAAKWIDPIVVIQENQ